MENKILIKVQKLIKEVNFLIMRYQNMEKNHSISSIKKQFLKHLIGLVRQQFPSNPI